MLTAACGGAVGCGGPSPSPTGGSSSPPGVSARGRTTDAAPSPSTVEPGAPVPAKPDAQATAKPTIVDADQYAAELQRQAGKVVLVDFWATWCGPCKEQFPHSNELAKKLAEKGLSVVSVSFDDPDNVDAVAGFLGQHPGPMKHLLSTYGAGVESFDNFAIEGGAVPFYKLYDRAGKLRYQFCGDPEGVQGVIKIEELDGKIDELLAEKAE